MNIFCFDDLLSAARQQHLPQRLLLAFAAAELPAGSTPEQRRRFEAGTGCALVPHFCVHKTPEEVENFAALKLESAQFNQHWQVVFVSTQSDDPNHQAATKAAAQALERMVADIKGGALANIIAFDQHGDAMVLRQPSQTVQRASTKVTADHRSF